MASSDSNTKPLLDTLAPMARFVASNESGRERHLSRAPTALRQNRRGRYFRRLCLDVVGVIFARLGRFDEAIADFDAAEELAFRFETIALTAGARRIGECSATS